LCGQEVAAASSFCPLEPSVHVARLPGGLPVALLDTPGLLSDMPREILAPLGIVLKVQAEGLRSVLCN
jgi:hypothetical protein